MLLREPLRREHLKPRLLGHWGSCSGITRVYAALNTLIKERDTDVLLITGPGHGATANHANLWLEGTHAQYAPALARTESGLRELAARSCAPDGFPSHLSPSLPGTSAARPKRHVRGSDGRCSGQAREGTVRVVDESRESKFRPRGGERDGDRESGRGGQRGG